MSHNHSEEINFQHYIEAVKQKTIPWHIFIDFMQDLSYSDFHRLRKLNAILLMELTVDYSDMDKLKYLNGILLTEFKNYIEKSEISESENLEDVEESNVLNEEKISTESDSEIQIPIGNEIKDNLTLSSEEGTIECNPNENDSKVFLCYICKKEYTIHFHLKQHIKKFTKRRKVIIFITIPFKMIKN